MLFPYKYVNHDITRLQQWVDFLFLHVWCNAKKEYSFDLLDGCPELKKLAEEEAWKEDPKKKAKDYITGPISVIYDIFKDELTPTQRKQIKRWYKRDKHLEKICNNKHLYNPLSRAALAKFSEKLSGAVYEFYYNLYEHVLDLAVVRNQNGTLENHYQDFIRVNTKGVCPFCGLAPMRSYEMDGHEAYDHYLPKEHYPLASINFKNLVPSCHACNSTHKFRQSPIFNNETNRKRKAFYPYSISNNDIELKIDVDFKNYKIYEHKHISIDFTSVKDKEQVKTWKDVYKLEKRYKDELTNEGAGKYWLVKLIEEMEFEDRKRELKRLPKALKNSKFKDKNFLKVPFLLACEEKGLL